MSLERREFLKLASLIAAGATVSACTPIYRVVGEAFDGPLPWLEGDGLTFRALQRMTYGPTLAERRHAADIGLPAWVEEQLAPASVTDLPGDLAVRPLASLPLEAVDLAAWERDDVVAELQRGALARRVFSRRQLFEVLVEFWTDHFNISIEKGACWFLKTIDDREVVRRHALGNFRDLLWASAHSPAMLVYLDNQANDRTAPNENYARELLELHTLGVDGGYTQRDVMEMARCLTGWTVRDRFWKGQFVFRPEMHDDGPKRVLRKSIEPAGQAEAESVLDDLAEHPATARRLARKLVRRFLELKPAEEQVLIQRAAAAFTASGGEILPMLRLILLDGVLRQPGGLSPKFKRPVHVVASALRMLHAVTNAGAPIQEHLARMGQPLFEWPTPDGPPDDPAAWQTGLFARWEFAYQLARNRIDGTEVDLLALLKTAGASGSAQTFDALSNIVLGSPLGEPARSEILRVLSKEAEDEVPALFLAGLLASPTFQWR
jgi:uncharacterized protein (DUF1800 family)